MLFAFSEYERVSIVGVLASQHVVKRLRAEQEQLEVLARKAGEVGVVKRMVA